ncbi:UTRA domain-containing protein [Gammaproteobacteria bacterium AS21]
MENSPKGPSHTLLIRDYIHNLFEKNQLNQQGKLPAERILCQRFGITRITLRQALIQLETEGFIYRQHHKGWFVSPARILYDPTQNLSFTEMALQQNRKPLNKILSAEKQLATAWMRESLNLAENESEVYCIRRLRSVDARPVMVENLYINATRCEGLLEDPIETSLTEVLKNMYGIIISRSSVRLHPTALTELQAKDLNGAAGTPSIYLIRTNYDQDDNIIEVDQEFWRHDALEITARSQVKTQHKENEVNNLSLLNNQYEQLAKRYEQLVINLSEKLSKSQQEMLHVNDRLSNLENKSL